MENYAVLPSLKGIGFKDRNLGEFPRAKRSPKPFLDKSGQDFRIISISINICRIIKIYLERKI
jgi:hypothetical protein